MDQNYRLNVKIHLPDINSIGYSYTHKCGAQILHIANDDINKAFNAIFKTPASDSTGIAHVLEHCLVKGSEKYPHKNLINALRKSSLATFINAVTWPDKTMYLFASRYEEDFHNIMNVYLDAIFFPLIYKNEKAFLQEGWHYSLDEPDGELKINGVVYNEMKRAYSNPYSVLKFKAMETLFPNSNYKFPSGGDPDYITELTNEHLKNFHKTFYHPSNSFLYFYGDMDIDKYLKILDNDIFSRFGGARPETEITMLQRQNPHNEPQFGEGYYSLPNVENVENKNYLGAAFALDKANAELLFSMNILSMIILESPSSPLKNSLLTIGESMNVSLDKYLMQPVMYILIKNSQVDAKDLQRIITSTLTKVVENGLDYRFVESCLDIFEFSQREANYGDIPKGLAISLAYLHRWHYGEYPFEGLAYLKYIARIRKRIASGERYFENLISNYILSNNFACYVTLRAKQGLQAEKDLLLKKRLGAYKERLSSEETLQIIENKKDLTNWQETEEIKITQNLIPQTSLSSIPKEADLLLVEKRVINNAKIMYVPIDTNGIIYNTFIFSTINLSKDEIVVMGILLHLLGKLDTSKRLFSDLINDQYSHFGGMNIYFKVYKHIDGTSFIPAVEVAVKFFEGKTFEVYSVVREILTDTIFDDKLRIKTLLSELKADIENSLLNYSNNYGSWRALAYMDNKGAYRDLVEGYGFYEHLKSLIMSYDMDFDNFRNKLIKVSRKIFVESTGSVSIACSEETFNDISKYASDFFSNLSPGGGEITEKLEPLTKNEGIIIESQLQYNVIAGNYLTAGFSFTGSLYVLMNILSQEYLFQELRVKGGAYGCSSIFTNDGCLYCSSFRDPHLKRTYEVFRGLASYVDNFNPGKKEMDSYILGTINRIDLQHTPHNKFERAVAGELMGITPELRQKERDELLATNAKKIREFAPLVSSCISQNNICTFGVEANINKNKILFDNIKRI